MDVEGQYHHGNVSSEWVDLAYDIPIVYTLMESWERTSNDGRQVVLVKVQPMQEILHWQNFNIGYLISTTDCGLYA